MDEVVERIESFVEEDLPSLVDAVGGADAALEALERPAEDVPFVVGALITLDPDPSPVCTEALRGAWHPVRAALLAHVEAEARLVLPGCRHVLAGRPTFRVALRTPLAQMIAEHRELEGALARVMEEASGVPAAREAFLRVQRLFDAHVEVLEGSIFPEAIEEDTDEFAALDADGLEDEAYAVEGEPDEAGPEPAPAPQPAAGFATPAPAPTLPPAQSAHRPPAASEPSADDIGAKLRAAAAERQARAATSEDEAGLLGAFRSLWRRR